MAHTDRNSGTRRGRLTLRERQALRRGEKVYRNGISVDRNGRPVAGDLDEQGRDRSQWGVSGSNIDSQGNPIDPSSPDYVPNFDDNDDPGIGSDGFGDDNLGNVVGGGDDEPPGSILTGGSGTDTSGETFGSGSEVTTHGTDAAGNATEETITTDNDGNVTRTFRTVDKDGNTIPDYSPTTTTDVAVGDSSSDGTTTGGGGGTGPAGGASAGGNYGGDSSGGDYPGGSRDPRDKDGDGVVSPQEREDAWALNPKNPNSVNHPDYVAPDDTPDDDTPLGTYTPEDDSDPQGVYEPTITYPGATDPWVDPGGTGDTGDTGGDEPGSILTRGKSGAKSIGGGYGKRRVADYSRKQMNLTSGRQRSLLTSNSRI